jgi:hypothetical protein
MKYLSLIIAIFLGPIVSNSSAQKLLWSKEYASTKAPRLINCASDSSGASALVVTYDEGTSVFWFDSKGGILRSEELSQTENGTQDSWYSYELGIRYKNNSDEMQYEAAVRIRSVSSSMLVLKIGRFVADWTYQPGTNRYQSIYGPQHYDDVLKIYAKSKSGITTKEVPIGAAVSNTESVDSKRFFTIDCTTKPGIWIISRYSL